MDERWIREDGLATLPTKTANDFLRFVPLVFFFLCEVRSAQLCAAALMPQMRAKVMLLETNMQI